MKNIQTNILKIYKENTQEHYSYILTMIKKYMFLKYEVNMSLTGIKNNRIIEIWGEKIVEENNLSYYIQENMYLNIGFSKESCVFKDREIRKNFNGEINVLLDLLRDKIYIDQFSNTFNFFQNWGCQYFPCHNNLDIKDFNCLFCYCPLYNMKDCGGHYELIDGTLKDCSKCLLPHNKKSYGYINEKLRRKNEEKNKLK